MIILAVDLAKAKQTRPDDSELWHELAALLVGSGQLDAYREHCRKSIDRFGNANDLNTAHRISKDCLTLPDSGVDLASIVRMADKAAEVTNDAATPWFQSVKALAEYRQGHFAQAVEWMNQVLIDPGKELERDVQAYMVRAMAHFQLHHTDEARADFAHGAEIVCTKLARLESGDLQDNSRGWLDRIIAQALMREAKALLNTDSNLR